MTALETALRAAADGILADTAATALLIDAGCFTRRSDFTRRFTMTAASVSDSTPLAWTDWNAAVAALDRGQLPAGSGEIAVLRIAASLAEGIPVDLHDTVTSLDNRNLALVTTAIRHAAGYR